MKSIYNNKRKLISYSLFAVSILSLVALLVMPIVFHMTASPFGLIIAFIGVIFFGSLAGYLRNSPPW